MHIYHIPAWWPTKENPIQGIFVFELIHAIALNDLHYHHTVGVHNSALKWISAANLFRDLRNLFHQASPLQISDLSNVAVRSIKRTIGMNPLTGIHYISSLIQKHKNLIYSLPTKPDLIHIHVSYPSLVIGHGLADYFNIPYMLTEHSSKFPDHRFETFGYSKETISEMLKVSSENITVSKTLANRFSHYDVEIDHIIPNSVNWNKSELTTVFKSPPFRFILIAQMNDPLKKIDILLHAVATLCKTDKNFICEIIGDGSLVGSYKQLADQLQIQPYITWRGFADREQKMTYLLHAQCLIISSEYETFGITAIEAHSFGLPVLSTRCGGTEELITPHNGIVVDKNNSKALAIGMQWMLQNYSSFSPKEIQHTCYERFDRHIIANRYLNIYLNILQSQPTRVITSR